MCCSCIPRTLFLATIASGQPLLLLPRNFRKSSSTFTIFWDSHCWCGAMAAVGRQDSKTPRSWGVTAKTAAIIMHLEITCGFTETWEKFIACENHSVQARTTASSTNFKVYQWPFQKLVSLAPSKNRKVETAISLSHHTIPFRPTVASSRRSHASHWIQSPSSRKSHSGAPWRNKTGILGIEGQSHTHQSLPVHENHWISENFDSDGVDDGIHTCSRKITNRHGAPIPSRPQLLSISSPKS